MEGNRGAGVLVRQTPAPTEVHSCQVRQCRIGDNAVSEGRGQVEITSDAHDLAFEGNEIVGDGAKPGFFVEDSVRAVYLANNTFVDTATEVEAQAESLAQTAPAIECGYGEWPEAIFRHLSVYAGG
jgi:hypothetical protein